jgi:hypothetical protein
VIKPEFGVAKASLRSGICGQKRLVIKEIRIILVFMDEECSFMIMGWFVLGTDKMTGGKGLL